MFKLSGFSNSVHSAEVLGMDLEVSDLKRVTVNKESKEDQNGIFHDLIFYPRVTSHSTLSIHHGRSHSPPSSTRLSPSLTRARIHPPLCATVAILAAGRRQGPGCGALIHLR
jgi:hypothetical protein